LPTLLSLGIQQEYSGRLLNNSTLKRTPLRGSQKIIYTTTNASGITMAAPFFSRKESLGTTWKFRLALRAGGGNQLGLRGHGRAGVFEEGAGYRDGVALVGERPGGWRHARRAGRLGINTSCHRYPFRHTPGCTRCVQESRSGVRVPTTLRAC